MEARASHDSSMINAPKPEYPSQANGIEGTLAVRLLVNVRNGLVEQACIIEGHQALAETAKEAGLRVKFSHYSKYIQEKFTYAEEIVSYRFSKP